MWAGHICGPFPHEGGGVVAGGRPLRGDAARAAPRPGAGEGPGSRVLGQDGHPQRRILAAAGSPAAGQRHLQVGDALAAARRLQMEPEVISCCFRCVLLGGSSLKKEATVSLVVGTSP